MKNLPDATKAMAVVVLWASAVTIFVATTQHLDPKQQSCLASFVMNVVMGISLILASERPTVIGVFLALGGVAAIVRFFTTNEVVQTISEILSLVGYIGFLLVFAFSVFLNRKTETANCK